MWALHFWHDALWRELPSATVRRFTHRLGSLHSIRLSTGQWFRAFSVELPEGFDVVLGPPTPFDPLGDADGTRRGLDELAALGTTVVNLTVRHDSLAHYLEQLEAFVALGGLDHPDVPPTSRTRGAE